MKRQHRFINILSVLIFSLILSSFVIPISGTIAASNLSNDTDQLNIDFDTKLKFYLDLKTKRFLKRMSLKEAFLSPEFVLDLWIVVRIMNSPIALLVLWICLTAVFYLILRKR